MACACHILWHESCVAMKGQIKEARVPTLIAAVKYVTFARGCNAAVIRGSALVHDRRKVA